MILQLHGFNLNVVGTKIGSTSGGSAGRLLLGLLKGSTIVGGRREDCNWSYLRKY